MTLEDDSGDRPSATEGAEQLPAKRLTLGGTDLEKLVNDTVEMATPLIKSESARWRRKTSELVSNGGGDQDDDETASQSQAKSVGQRTFEKAAVSLMMNTFVIVVAYIIGTIFYAFLGIDLGVLAFWLHNLNVVLLFAVDKNTAGVRRVDDPTDFDKLTAGAHLLPLVWLLATGYNLYWQMFKCVVLQVVFKVVIMSAKSQVVQMLL